MCNVFIRVEERIRHPARPGRHSRSDRHGGGGAAASPSPPPFVSRFLLCHMGLAKLRERECACARCCRVSLLPKSGAEGWEGELSMLYCLLSPVLSRARVRVNACPRGRRVDATSGYQKYIFGANRVFFFSRKSFFFFFVVFGWKNIENHAEVKDVKYIYLSGEKFIHIFDYIENMFMLVSLI